MTTKKQEFELVQVEGIPVPAAFSIVRPDRYGTVEGLDEDELANPAELERQVYQKEYGPILALPVKHKWHGPRPEMDEDGHIGWGAFGSIDWNRLHSFTTVDKARYKADLLQDEFESEVIMVGIIKERIPGKAKYLVLKYLKMGIIDLNHIKNPDMWALARHCLRAWRLQKEIRSLRSFSWQNR